MNGLDVCSATKSEDERECRRRFQPHSAGKNRRAGRRRPGSGLAADGQAIRSDLGRHQRPAADAAQGRECFAEVEPLGNGALATIDLPTRHYRNYYEGFANSVLWPALHSRPDLIQVTADEYASYREVNACMARGLLRFSDPQTVYWVQDYHFLTLGAELRQLGVDASDRLLPAHAVAERGTMLARAASRRSGAGDARL